MIWVILGICALLLFGSIIGVVRSMEKSDTSYISEDPAIVLSIVGLVLSIVLTLTSLIIGIVLGVKMTGKTVVDQQIIIYEQENAQLESDIDIIVKAYIEHEGGTFSNFKNESSIVLVQLFPELKSNELIIRQIDIINTNNQEIKTLKSERARFSQIRWWLCFKY